MPDIYHQFPIKASAQQVYRAVSTPAGLDCWWTKRSAGTAESGAQYELWFGPEYDWRGVVTRAEPGIAFELNLTVATKDWIGTRVAFLLSEQDGVCTVCFSHTGWAGLTPHYQTSMYCWAMYLRLLKRYVEREEIVPYEMRLEA